MMQCPVFGLIYQIDLVKLRRTEKLNLHLAKQEHQKFIQYDSFVLVEEAKIELMADTVLSIAEKEEKLDQLKIPSGVIVTSYYGYLVLMNIDLKERPNVNDSLQIYSDLIFKM